jgi:predicted enzyme related to lactoylglutathione lyase
MEMLQNAINWFEIPVSDFERAKKFYSTIYDYDMPEFPMGPVRMGILLYDQQKQGIGGAIVKGDGYVPSKQGAKVYLNGGSDLNIVLQRVEKAGGKIILPKTRIDEQLGYFAIFEDTEGNQVSIHSAA